MKQVLLVTFFSPRVRRGPEKKKRYPALIPPQFIWRIPSFRPEPGPFFSLLPSPDSFSSPPLPLSLLHRGEGCPQGGAGQEEKVPPPLHSFLATGFTLLLSASSLKTNWWKKSRREKEIPGTLLTLSKHIWYMHVLFFFLELSLFLPQRSPPPLPQPFDAFWGSGDQIPGPFLLAFLQGHKGERSAYVTKDKGGGKELFWNPIPRGRFPSRFV